MSKYCKIVGNILGKPVLAKDLWGHDSIENIASQVISKPKHKATLTRVRGGWELEWE
jgi:hypothetical protein